MECLVRDKEAVKRKYKDIVVDNATLEDIYFEDGAGFSAMTSSIRSYLVVAGIAAIVLYIISMLISVIGYNRKQSNINGLGCAPEHREEASIEPSSVSEAKPGETPVSIQIFAPEDVKVTPEIVEYIVTAITFYHPTAG